MNCGLGAEDAGQSSSCSVAVMAPPVSPVFTVPFGSNRIA